MIEENSMLNLTLYNDIFVNEDISKPENRMNLAIFHLQMLQEFHKWFCNKLGIPISSVIYPIENVSGNRPDFIIKDDRKIIGYVEVELGDENKHQLSTYKEKILKDGIKIYSISSRTYHKSDLSLDEIVEYFERLNKSELSEQQKLSIIYLQKIIYNYSNNTKMNKRDFVSDKMLSNIFVSEFLSYLKEFAPTYGLSRAVQGSYFIDTVGENGFSFRVFSQKSKVASKSLSILSITNNRDFVLFQSAEKYRTYLAHKKNVDVGGFIDFIENKLQANIGALGINSRMEVPLFKVRDYIQELVEVIKPLI